MSETKRGRQVFRLFCIIGVLKSHDRNGISVERLTRELWEAMGMSPEEKISSRTVRRDLEVLETQMRCIDKRDGKYFPGEAIREGIKVGATYEEMLSVFLAAHLLEGHEGTPVRTGLDSLWEKFSPMLNAQSRKLFRAMQDAFFIKADADSARPDAGIVNGLYLAIERCCTVKLLYQTIHAREANETYYDPYAIVYHNGRPYLVAESHRRRSQDTVAVISLKVCRIKKLTFTGRTFTRPTDLAIRKKLAGSVGIFVGGRRTKYRVRLNAFAARLVGEDPWHPSQKLRKAGEDRYMLTLEVDNNIELTPRILALGPDAEVLEPASYRREIAEKLATAAEAYAV
jgi:predicted DNA-binding transcriptional regulator YafY